MKRWSAINANNGRRATETRTQRNRTGKSRGNNMNDGGIGNGKNNINGKQGRMINVLYAVLSAAAVICLLIGWVNVSYVSDSFGGASSYSLLQIGTFIGHLNEFAGITLAGGPIGFLLVVAAGVNVFFWCMFAIQAFKNSELRHLLSQIAGAMLLFLAGVAFITVIVINSRAAVEAAAISGNINADIGTIGLTPAPAIAALISVLLMVLVRVFSIKAEAGSEDAGAMPPVGEVQAPYSEFVRCGSCGAVNKKGMNYCLKCGGELAAVDKPESRHEQLEDVMEAAAVEAVEPAAEDAAETATIEAVESAAEAATDDVAELEAVEAVEPAAEDVTGEVTEAAAEDVTGEVAEPAAEAVVSEVIEAAEKLVTVEVAEVESVEVIEPAAAESTEAEPIEVAELAAEDVTGEVAEPAAEAVVSEVIEAAEELVIAEAAEVESVEVVEPAAAESTEAEPSEVAELATEDVAGEVAELAAEDVVSESTEAAEELVTVEAAEVESVEVIEPATAESTEAEPNEVAEPAAEDAVGEVIEPAAEAVAEAIAGEVTEPAAEDVVSEVIEEAEDGTGVDEEDEYFGPDEVDFAGIEPEDEDEIAEPENEAEVAEVESVEVVEPEPEIVEAASEAEPEDEAEVAEVESVEVVEPESEIVEAASEAEPEDEAEVAEVESVEVVEPESEIVEATSEAEPEVATPEVIDTIGEGQWGGVSDPWNTFSDPSSMDSMQGVMGMDEEDEQMVTICPECGEYLSPGALFCSNCGSSF
jgi:hypothetical protein